MMVHNSLHLPPQTLVICPTVSRANRNNDQLLLIVFIFIQNSSGVICWCVSKDIGLNNGHTLMLNGWMDG